MASARRYSACFTGFAFVAYPNRDFTPFREKYSIPEAQTVTRRALRYEAFPEVDPHSRRHGLPHPGISRLPQPLLGPFALERGHRRDAQVLILRTGPDLGRLLQDKLQKTPTKKPTASWPAIRWIALFSGGDNNPFVPLPLTRPSARSSRTKWPT